MLVLGDDAIECFEADWLDFRTPAVELAKQLYKISKSSGVCCGVIGPWGSGKSSFVRLMDEYIQKESSWKKVDVTWFTAWDPGGIQDLGDAMLYNFFRDVTTKNQEMNGIFKELKKALGIRRSFKERASRVLESASAVIPSTPGRAVTAAAGKILRELEVAKTVQDCFEKLMNWLEKENRTVFFFIDDIDRATGEQIRDLLSELKIYISHRRIVAVLGFDEDYVLNALEPVLPSGIDPRRYLEKVVTIRRNLPIPQPSLLLAYASQLLRSMLDLPEARARILARVATKLSSNNPRRLKILILAFAQLLLPIDYKKHSPFSLQSMLVTTAAVNMGFVADDAIKGAIESGREDGIVSAIEEFVKKDSSKSKDAKLLTEAINYISPSFVPGTLGVLGLSGQPRILGERELEEELVRSKRFDWRFSFTPLLSSAASQGFTLHPSVAESSSKIVIPPSTETADMDAKPFLEVAGVFKRSLRHSRFEYLLPMSWSESNMIILLTSFMREREARTVVRQFFNACAHFVAEKSFIFWLIDDQGLFIEQNLKRLSAEAQKISNGLKHPFIFLYTPSSKVQSLLAFLLRVASKQN